MATPTKIKVGREVLLARLQELETENQESYLSSLDAYGEEVEEFCLALAEQLRIFAAVVLSLDAPEQLEERVSNAWRNGVKVTFSDLRKPEAPNTPDKTLGKLIRTLELSTEDTITVSATDTYYHYL